jgi:hypothetical protein
VRPVLLVGGPRDGQWVHVPDGAISYTTYDPPPLQVVFEPLDDIVPVPPRVARYRVEPVMIEWKTSQAVFLIGYLDRRPTQRELVMRLDSDMLDLIIWEQEWRTPHEPG